jgi:hypothetical protein
MTAPVTQRTDISGGAKLDSAPNLIFYLKLESAIHRACRCP